MTVIGGISASRRIKCSGLNYSSLYFMHKNLLSIVSTSMEEAMDCALLHCSKLMESILISSSHTYMT